MQDKNKEYVQGLAKYYLQNCKGRINISAKPEISQEDITNYIHSIKRAEK